MDPLENIRLTAALKVAVEALGKVLEAKDENEARWFAENGLGKIGWMSGKLRDEVETLPAALAKLAKAHDEGRTRRPDLDFRLA